MASAIPLATYRLQLTPSFGFDQAAAIVPYLKTLGITHLYASPFLKARSGSTHGYDIIDHNAFNPELGDEDGFLRLSAALTDADIGLILDFVPNHMGVLYADNAWWLDLLEWGPKSPHAASFDIEWDTLPDRPRGGVLLPILGRPYGEALDNGEIALRYNAQEGSFSAWYFEHRMPIGPSRYGEIVSKVVAQADATHTSAGKRLLELVAQYRGPTNPPRHKAPQFKQELASIPGAADIIARGLTAFDPKSGVAGAVTALHRLLERQYYRPAFWRLAANEINYRRFFDINTLAGLRVENLPTFEAIHRLVSRLISAGQVQGLRIDHIDGLRDPQQYLRRLQSLIRHVRPAGRMGFYLVIEKILAEGERLPRFPGVSGTTGYEWLNTISRLLLHEPGLETLERAWKEAGDHRSFVGVLAESKRRVLANILASEFTVLARLLARIAAGHYSTRDYAPDRLRAALAAYVIHFPVYRTYITSAGPSADDRTVIEATIAKARAEWFGSDSAIFDFLRDALTLDLVAPGRSGHSVRRVRRFAFKVQQLTGPVMAKSMEDTAFYRYHRLLALNEVGGEPAAGAVAPEDFHARMLARAETLPHGLTATATHDTKRGEDARARILALSEMAEGWTESVGHWRSLNGTHTTRGLRAPSPAHEYMLYQALIGAWPLGTVDRGFVERMQAYAVKAAREGKEQTSWLAPQEIYEKGLTDFIARILDPEQSPNFLVSFEAIARRAALMGALNSLVQLTLKATLPGVPDFYQGTEFWDLSLVDPDNRRPVDFSARSAALTELGDNPDWTALLHDWSDGRIKLALTKEMLAIRTRFAALFTYGNYRPLTVTGPQAAEVFAFARSHGRDTIIVAVRRLFGRTTDQGRVLPQPDTAPEAAIKLGRAFRLFPLIPGIAKTQADELPAAALFHHLPVAILHAEPIKIRKPQLLAAS